ncbi:MAG: TolC family protein, partial [Muribaculaceae bacterium]|nr:TolC family protein [Muribaculaceae bacterium]
KMSWSYTIPAQISWEVDVFGKLTNSKRSAEAAMHQAEDYAQAVRSQIIAGVANCYYSIASVKKQLELYRTTSKLWGETVEVMENMKEAGRTTEAAVVQSKANYYSILAGITDLEVSLQKLNSSLSLLLNEKPGEWNVASNATLKAPAMVMSATPMSALVCRPDVAAAERGMYTAFDAYSIAKGVFFPALNITAQRGFTNLLGGMLKNPGDWMAQLAGAITAPIFSRGQNTARLEAAKKQQEQALNTFESTLLSACKEIEDLMVVYTKAESKATYLTQQVANLEKSVEYTNDLLQYSNGTYLEVITAMQSLLGAQMSQLSNDLTRTQTIISLYQAMGGGR